MRTRSARSRALASVEEAVALLPVDSSPKISKVQLRQRGHSQENGSTADPLSRYEFIHHTLQPGQTLAGIALRYNCQVSLLKQCNGLSNDSHLFALRTIKVPVPRNGMLTDNLVDISSEVTIEREGPAREELCPTKYMQNLDEKLKNLQETLVNGDPCTTERDPVATKPRVIISNLCIVVGCLLTVCVGLPILYTLYILLSPLHGDIFKIVPS